MKSLLLVVLFAVAVSCSENALRSFLTDNLPFRADLYQEVLAKNEGNVILSPLAITFLLTYVHYGAQNATFHELHHVLHIPHNHSELEVAIENLRAGFRQSVQHIKVHTVNAAFVKQGFPIQAEFQRVSNDVFHAHVENIDFLNAGAANTINQWVGQNTENRIANLVSPSDLNNNTRVLLINALYFKASWLYPFHKFATKPRDFHVSQSQSVQADAMERVSRFNYLESSELDGRVVEVPFEGDASLVIVLPNQIEGLQSLQARSANYSRLITNLTQKRLRVVLPKFEINTEIHLKPILQQLGIVKAFDADQADFSGISGQPGDLVLNDVVQKAFIKVDEDGVEAAAATIATIAVPTAAIIDPEPIVDFIVDRPFLFYVKLRGVALFAGRVVNPSQ